jgi:crotonobetainyl-CoA:carnitine CoA-transferase CaiB-like acyl-CoA transferase
VAALPLDGILVVALEQAVAAPFCTSRLADAGARVVKIERSEGDFARGYDHVAHGESAYFVWLNRGKESIVLDVKAPDDAAVLNRMLARADVFVQNLAPGAAARAGFASEELRRRHPRLITCDISGYGEDGPYRDMKAYDLLVQCETGLASITGAPETPGRVGVSIADIACGMYAHAAVLQALYQRERTGEGRGVAVSLFDSIADWMTVPLLHQDYAGKAPYGAFDLADGHKVAIAIQNEREWRAFCADVLGERELAADARFASNTMRVANRLALDTNIAAYFASLSREEASTRLRRAKIAFGAVNEVADLSLHPQLRRITIDTPTGPVDVAAPPPRWDAQPFEARPVPAIGQHTLALRQEFAL